jgi:hypothetical protein
MASENWPRDVQNSPYFIGSFVGADCIAACASTPESCLATERAGSYSRACFFEESHETTWS